MEPGKWEVRWNWVRRRWCYRGSVFRDVALENMENPATFGKCREKTSADRSPGRGRYRQANAAQWP